MLEHVRLEQFLLRQHRSHKEQNTGVRAGLRSPPRRLPAVDQLRTVSQISCVIVNNDVISVFVDLLDGGLRLQAQF